MKLKIKKTFRLANPVVSKPHWHFTKDQVLDTDNEYLIDRLLNLKCADILDKGNNTKKMPEPENKMIDTSEAENKQDEVKNVTPKKILTINTKVKKVSSKKKGN